MLVGRESERQTIATLLAGARVGESRVLVLSGEPGIGKSALLAEAQTEALARDMRVLRARGLESEQVVPFAGLLQALRPLLGSLDQVPAPQAQALSAALLLDAPGEAEPSRFAVGAATLSLLTRAAEDRPLVLLVDDAHWLDRPSAEALVFAARRLASDAVAVLVVAREGDPGAAVWATLPTLAIRGLDLDAAGQLLGSAGSEHLTRLHRVTAGNPLALLELRDHANELAALPSDSAVPVSHRISRAFHGQVEQLGDDARLVLLVAAADSASAATVLAASARLGVASPRLTDAEDAGLVAVHDDRVEFRHPLVRSAVYGAADPRTRRTVHRALAAVVSRDQLDRFAWHLARGTVPPDEEAAVVLDEVAEEATARGAHAIAALAHERAAALSGASALTSTRLAAAGEAAWLAGLTDRAATLLDRALASRPDPLLRAHICEVRGAVETRCGSLDAALVTCLDAARDVEAIDPDVAVRLYADAIHVAFYLLDPAAARRAGEAIESLLDAASDPRTRYLGAVASGMALVLAGSGAAGIERLRESVHRLVLPDEGRAPDPFRLPLQLQGALWLRDAGPRRAVLNDAIERMREDAALGSLPYVLMHVARDDATTDRWQDAQTAYLESVRLARELGQTTDLAVSLAGLALLDARCGRANDCRANATTAEELAARSHVQLASVWSAFALGDLAAGFGDLAGAVGSYERLVGQLDAAGLADPDQSCAPELVEVLVHLGRADRARVMADRFAEKALAKGHPWSLARAKRALALCDSGDDAEAHFRAALELHGQTPDVYERARTELAYGAWLRRGRRRVEARPMLAKALRTFDELGAGPWADRAARELQATGATARRSRARADDLTPQERQIAQLLASGRTTRETAAALFLSPKTVEYHLRHVYLKLGIRSRPELAAALAPAAPHS